MVLLGNRSRAKRGESVTAPAHLTAELGELVVTAFDKANEYSADPHEVTRLAAGAVMRLLERSRWLSARQRGRGPH